MSETTWYEYGYRTDATGEVWAYDYGHDGAWTDNLPECGIRNIDMYAGREVEAIRMELTRAGYEGVILRRKITQTVSDPETVEDVKRA